MPLYKFFAIISIFGLFIPSVFSQNNSTYASSAPSIPAKNVGIYIEDIRTGEVVLDINGEKTFIPASVTKIVTVSSALCQLKPSDSFETKIYICGDVKNGTLEGNVIIKCSGDPTIESRHFPTFKGFAKQIAAKVKALGVKEISGKVMVDGSRFLEQPTPLGWMDEDLIHPYGTELHAANYADNLVTLTMSPLKTTPETPGLQAKHTGRTRRQRGGVTVESVGTRQIANPLPGSTMVRAVVNELNKLSVHVIDQEIEPAGPLKLLYTHNSPRYYDIIQSLMYRSDNLMAEGMLRAMATDKPRKYATDLELNIWRKNGIDVKGIVIEDGSGLSRNNRISPYFLAEVLDWMRIHKNPNNSFTNIFPMAGRSGTMRNFLKGTPLEGKIVAKTGSMRNVQCYAGFKIDDTGQPTHIVVAMLNDFTDRGALKSALAKLLVEKLAD